MIWVTRLNGTEMVVNADLLESIESTPDTVLTLVDGKRYVISESAAEVVERVRRFRASGASGQALVGTPGTAGRGSMAAGTLEMSNVDLAQEFTNLIIAQRGFQANSRIITASDEMLQDLVNLKR